MLIILNNIVLVTKYDSNTEARYNRPKIVLDFLSTICFTIATKIGPKDCRIIANLQDQDVISYRFSTRFLPEFHCDLVFTI